MLGMDTQLKVGSLWENDYILHDMSSYNDGDNDDDDDKDSNNDYDIPDDESLKHFPTQES